MRWAPNRDSNNAWYLQPQPDNAKPPDPTTDWTYKGAFGSSHPGIFNAAFCDGTVKTVRLTVDPFVLRTICTRSDGGNETAASTDGL